MRKYIIVILAAALLFTGCAANAGAAGVISQPEAAGSIQSTMFIGLAMAETSGIYGLLIAIILLFANPLIPIYLQNAVR